jgi:hypothetical protein
VNKHLIATSWIVALAIMPLGIYAADEPPVLITPDGGRYWGPVVGGMLQGEGRIEWSNGASYSGSFANGLFSGKGRFNYPTGDVIEGDFEQGMPSGTVILKTNSGGLYQGQARSGLLDGHGRFEDNGNVYEGEFQKNLYHGQGHFVTSVQEYTGEFRQGQFWGKGELRQKNGRVYVGEFVRGEFDGDGRYTIPNGPTYEGQFADGSFQGHGAITNPDGGKLEGEFRNWQPEGHGKYTDPENNTWEGEFKAGQMVGKATTRKADGSRYVGEMQNWVPHGQGVFNFANGDVYEGEFSYGMYEGQGTLTYAKPLSDGETQKSGRWEYGRLKKEVEEESRRNEANVERALYTEVEQLDRALGKLEPRSGEAINLYFLGIAGDGGQEVFRREIDFVRAQFEAEFGARNHAISLINSRNTAGSTPLATVTSIRKAVSAIAAKMDKDRDILFLYLTSHGSKEGTLRLGLNGMQLPDLSAAELASLLKESGIRWKVVVISACYSGSFMETLKDPGTLLITAARADRPSFGCADENDFTYFGRAFFKESLPSSKSFEDAFAKASGLVKEWEDKNNAKQAAVSAKLKDEEDSEPAAEKRYSLPQMEAPEAIRKHLKQWRDDLARKANRNTPR